MYGQTSVALGMSYTDVVTGLLVPLDDQGGATVDLSGMSVLDGCVVGRPGMGFSCPRSQLSLAATLAWLAQVAPQMSGRPAGQDSTQTQTVGSWVDTETGKVYLDVCDRFTDEEEAKRACLERGELAYYNLSEGREVRVA